MSGHRLRAPYWMRLRIARTATVWAVVVVALKGLVLAGCAQEMCVQVVQATDIFRPVFASVLGGVLFVFGLMLAGTLSDYKEAERMPAEIRACLENVWVEAVLLGGTFDVAALRARILAFLAALKRDMLGHEIEGSIAVLRDLNASVRDMEPAGLAATYVSRLKNELGSLRRVLLRMHHIQRTDFVPSAMTLLESVVGLVLAVLLVTGLGRTIESLFIAGTITYIFVYVVRLLRVLENPFQPDKPGNMDDVSLHVLHEFEREMASEAPEAV